jgi:hypothetical protein
MSTRIAIGLVIGALAAGCEPCAEATPDGAEFLKGQLHVHTNRSGDGRGSPEQVARWYAAHDYDFIVFTDHERITDLPLRHDLLTIPGIELTQNLRTCDPEPAPGDRCLLHVNALFVHRLAGPEVPWSPLRSLRRIDLYQRALETTRTLGGLAQLNHPNFHWAADGPLIANLAHHGLSLLEIANESDDCRNEGDARHPGTEALWDAVLATGAHLWGVASDDAHQLGEGDRGFVMVRAARDPDSIRSALERGDFYASTGVRLATLEVRGHVLALDVARDCPGPHEFTVIGHGGTILGRQEGRKARIDLRAARGGTLRVVVRDGRGHAAWIQPTAAPAE